jgi:hypothetical protein
MASESRISDSCLESIELLISFHLRRSAESNTFIPFSTSIRTRFRRPLFQFPFDIEKLAVSLDLNDCGLAARQFTKRPAQLLHAKDRHTV